MTELQIYKFIKENNIEWHKRDNKGKPDVLLFPLVCHIEDFNKLVSDATDEEGIKCYMKDGYFAFWMNDIFDYFGLEIENVFIGED